jgi:Domain of unknown function (DU1801)
VGGRNQSDEDPDLVAGVTPEVRDLALAVRRLVYDVLPQTVEVIWPKQGSVGWGTGPKKFTEQFAYLMPFKQHVTLGFCYGGELPDPAGLLPTAGRRQVSGRLAMRSMKITSLEQVRQPALRALLHEAVQHKVPAPAGE